MANDLTGDYDVAVEFTIPAANRVLAAMHRGQRFPHSLSLRVYDALRLSLTFPVTLHETERPWGMRPAPEE